MKKITTAICLTLASCSATPSLAGPTFPDRDRAGVVDAAAVIPDGAERALNAKVVAWDKATGHQLVVATVPSLGGLSIADYGVALGRKWGLGHGGSKFASDGVILLLAPHERRVRIEVGYGLEPVLTDALTSEIIRNRIVPRLKASDIPGALNDGASATMAAATPTVVPQVANKATALDYAWTWYLTILVGLCGGGIIMSRRARRRAKEAARAATEVPINPAPRAPSIVWPSRPLTPTPPRLTRTVGGDLPRAEPIPFTRYPPPPPPPQPSPSYDYGSTYTSPRWPSDDSSSSSSSDSGSSWGDSGSGSSSGFDSGGGSFGGGGSDSGY